jgi:uncharacterized phage protein (TIGR02220 family)
MTCCPNCGYDLLAINGERAVAVEVLDFLNSKRPGKRGFPPTEANLRLIAARIRETDVQTCKSVVANRVREWGRDDTMRRYIRPATIFNATKFSQYAGELNDA